METLAILSSAGRYSLFSAGGDIVRFATSPRLLRYTRVKRWDDGYLEVGADYGHGEVEDYIDIRQILDNLYYDTDSFLRNIKKRRFGMDEEKARTIAENSDLVLNGYAVNA